MCGESLHCGQSVSRLKFSKLLDSFRLRNCRSGLCQGFKTHDFSRLCAIDYCFKLSPSPDCVMLFFDDHLLSSLKQFWKQVHITKSKGFAKPAVNLCSRNNAIVTSLNKPSCSKFAWAKICHCAFPQHTTIIALTRVAQVTKLIEESRLFSSESTMDSEKVLDWLVDNKILSISLDGNIDHSQYCDKIRRVVEFIGDKLSSDELALLWKLQVSLSCL